jgi:hypothetical protein
MCLRQPRSGDEEGEISKMNVELKFNRQKVRLKTVMTYFKMIFQHFSKDNKNHINVGLGGILKADNFGIRTNDMLKELMKSLPLKHICKDSSYSWLES